MRIAIVGAGIAGVTAAQACAARGHSVTVYERRGSVAAEASYAQLGLLAPSLAGPGALSPFAAFRARNWWRLPREADVRPGWSPAQWRWLWQMREHMARRSALQQALRRLAAYGLQQHRELMRVQRLEYEGANGHMVLLQDTADLARAEEAVEHLREQGIAVQKLSAATCRDIEPGLECDAKLAAAVVLPGDEAANCRQVAHLLKEACERMGVEFRFATEVTAVIPGRTPRIHSASQTATTSFVTSRQAGGGNATRPLTPPSYPAEDDFDAVLLCTGAQSVSLLHALGVTAPLMPVRSYSITANVRHVERCPRGIVTDAKEGVAVVRLGQRIRVAGGLELGARVHGHRDETLRSLYATLDRWFPGAAHKTHAQAWKGTSLMLPDGLPLLGASGAPGVWLDLGHGAQGWATASASADLLADAVSGRGPAIDISPYSLDRLGQR